MYRFGKKSKERLKGVDSNLVKVLNELIKIAYIEDDQYKWIISITLDECIIT